jgi:hypothetical protein
MGWRHGRRVLDYGVRENPAFGATCRNHKWFDFTHLGRRADSGSRMKGFEALTP